MPDKLTTDPTALQMVAVTRDDGELEIYGISELEVRRSTRGRSISVNMSTGPAKQTTNMTAAEAVDFLNVWGEAELRKVTDMSAPTNQTPPAASTHIRDDTECCLVPVPLVKPADIPRIGVAGSGYAERDTMNDTPTTPTTKLDDMRACAGEWAEQANKLLAENSRMEEALERIVRWADAYPASVFPVPDEAYLKKAHEALTVAGLSLDRLSADAMRHVVQGVGKIAREALQ